MPTMPEKPEVGRRRCREDDDICDDDDVIICGLDGVRATTGRSD